MKKQTIVFTLCIVLSLLLAACQPGDEVNGTPGVTDPGLELTGTPAEALTETPLEPMVTPEGDPEIPEPPVATESVDAAETAAATEMIPETGFMDPGQVSNLLDLDVWNRNDEQIGTVEDMVFNLDTQQIDYLLVEAGGFLGVGGKLVAVPYDRIEVDAGAKESSSEMLPEAIYLDITREELENYPGIDPRVFPELGEPAGNYDLDFSNGDLNTTSMVNETPQATEDAAGTPETMEETSMMGETRLQGIALASELLDLTLRDAQGAELAAVEDVIVDPETGALLYLAVEIKDMEDLDGQWMLIPFYLLSIHAEKNALVISVDQDVLAGAPVFEAGELPDTTSSGWDAHIQTYWEEHKS